MRYALIKTLRPRYPLAVLCRVFDVSRSGYHAYRLAGAVKTCPRE